jgi:hypothetical protein
VAELKGSYREPGFYWFRVFGWGLTWKRTDMHRLLFSERVLGHGWQVGRWRIGGAKAVSDPIMVYVRWFDSAVYGGEAFDPKDLAGYCENETAGLLIADDDEKITVALDRCIETEKIRLALCIPRVNVRSVQYFHPSREADTGRGQHATVLKSLAASQSREVALRTALQSAVNNCRLCDGTGFSGFAIKRDCALCAPWRKALESRTPPP